MTPNSADAAVPDRAANPIVVAYDGSPDAQAALQWAIPEAKLRGLALEIVYVRHDFATREAAAAPVSWSPAVVASLLPPGDDIVAEGAARATAAGVAVSTAVLEGPTASALADRSANAALIVMGSRGVGAIQGAFLGAVVPHVTSHSRCPVIVVRAESDPTGPVVVGVDGSPESLETLGWAFDYAHRHGRDLHVRYAFEVPIYPEIVPYVPPVEVIDEVTRSADHAVSDEVARWTGRYPSVQVTSQAVQDRPVRALTEASREASIVVVGSHGRGGFAGMLLGSTSQALLHHTHSSVAVIRHWRPLR